MVTKVSASQIRHTPDFAGGVARSLADKLGEVVSVRDFGAVGDGVTDDTVALRLACLAAENKILLITGKIRITGDVVMKNVTLVAPNYSITGSGYVRGVVDYSNTPFFCKFNTVCICSRSDQIQSADVYVDCILGDDASTGTLQQPLRTLGAAKVTLVDLYSQGNQSPKAVLRSGRYETNVIVFTSGEAIQQGFDTQANPCDEGQYQFINSSFTTIEAANGENVQITPTLEWVFRNSPDITRGDRGGYSHTQNSILHQLIDPYEMQPVELAALSNVYGLSANIEENITTLDAWQSSNLTVSSNVKGLIEESFDFNNHVLLKVWHWFNTQLYKGVSLTGNVITLDSSSYSLLSDFYTNGWAQRPQYSSVQSGGAPFDILNLPAAARDCDFFSTPTHVYLPNDKKRVFAIPEKTGTLISSAGGLRLSGLTFLYADLPFNELQAVHTTHDKYTVNLGKQNISELKNCNFINCTLGGGLAFIIRDSKVTNTGSGGFDCQIALNNSVKQPGVWNVHGQGISATHAAHYNKIEDCAINGITTSSNGLKRYIKRNFINGIGTINGAPTMKNASTDGGAIYTFGQTLGTPVTPAERVEIAHNVILNVCNPDGDGIFGDDGSKNLFIHGNLIGHTSRYGINVRLVIKDVADYTAGNVVRSNLCVTGLRVESNIGATGDDVSVAEDNGFSDQLYPNSFANSSTSRNSYIVASERDGAVCVDQRWLRAYLSLPPLNGAIIRLDPFVTQFIRSGNPTSNFA